MGEPSRGKGLDRATVEAQGEGDEGLLKELQERVQQLKATKKIQQIVWLDPRTFAKVLEFADALRLAPNTVISLIVEDYIAKGGKPLKMRTQVVEKVNERELVICPECTKKFPDLITWREHLKQNPNELKNLIRELMELTR